MKYEADIIIWDEYYNNAKGEEAEGLGENWKVLSEKVPEVLPNPIKIQRWLLTFLMVSGNISPFSYFQCHITLKVKKCHITLK